MPKVQNGVLIKCEKTIKIYIKNISQGKDWILKDIDELHLFVKESAINSIQEEVFKMQDKNAYNPIEVVK
jgi:hypothetical protein